MSLHKSEEDYEIDSAADALIRVEEIKQDKKLYAAAMKKVQEKAKAVTAAAKEMDLEKKVKVGLKKVYGG